MEYGCSKSCNSNNKSKLFEITEFECLDIDYEWQFDLYTNYWEKING